MYPSLLVLAERVAHFTRIVLLYTCLSMTFTSLLLQYFRPNPYFSNPSLSKEYTLETTGETTVVGTEINWKEGMVRTGHYISL